MKPRILTYILLLLSVPSQMIAEDKKEEKKEETKSFREQTIDKAYIITDTFTHEWIKFPTFSATKVSDGKTLKYKNKEGIATVLIFISSWCVRCQQLTPYFLELEKKYNPLSTKFYYIFAQDTLEDAKGYVKEFKMENSTSILGNNTIIKTFKNPPNYPAVYIGDRHNWLTKMFFKADQKDLNDLDSFLEKITAI